MIGGYKKQEVKYNKIEMTKNMIKQKVNYYFISKFIGENIEDISNIENSV